MEWQRSHRTSSTKLPDGGDVQPLSVQPLFVQEGAVQPPSVQVVTAGGGVRIYALDDEARAAGLYPGKMVSEARALIPNLQVTEADPERDRAALQDLARWCGRYSPWVSQVFCGNLEAETAGLWFDISGCAHLFGGEDGLLYDLVEKLDGFGVEGRAAAAPTAGAAWALARYGCTGRERSAVLANGKIRDRLSGLSVKSLRLSDEILDGLEKLGLVRVGDLYKLPRMTLTRRFGPQLILRLDQALGEVSEPITPEGEVPAYVTRCTFPDPIGKIEDIEAATLTLLEELGEILVADRMGARKLVLHTYRADGGVSSISIGTSRASAEPTHLHKLFLEKTGDIEAGFGIDVMTMTALETDQISLVQVDTNRAAGAEEDIGALIDRIGNRLGLASVVTLKPHESHQPEWAFKTAMPFAGGSFQDIEDAESESWPQGHLPGVPRPIRMLSVPEPVEVDTNPDTGVIEGLRWRRVAYDVRFSEGPERLSEEWWRDVSTITGERALNVRDYYRIETAADNESSHRFWIYAVCPEGREAHQTADAWFIHGVFA